MHSLQHIHLRKHKTKNHIHPYPSKKPLIKILDLLIYTGSLILPIMTIPQIYEIWVKRNAAGVSSATWLAYTSGSALWLVYGVVHREKPIFIANTIMVIVQFIVLIGSLIY
jgi:uncharacterized protein with PQ loop repeat